MSAVVLLHCSRNRSAHALLVVYASAGATADEYVSVDDDVMVQSQLTADDVFKAILGRKNANVNGGNS